MARVRLVVASAPPIVVAPVAELVTPTVLPLSTSVPKLLPAVFKRMPLLPAVEAWAVKLATPATEIAPLWMMPVGTAAPSATVGALAVAEILPAMSLAESVSTMALPPTSELLNERLVASLMTVRLPV